MALKYGKTEISKIAAVLDREDFESAEEAAVACLKAMEEVFASRAKFVVVGQLGGDRESSMIPASSERAIRMSLGWYSTEGEAKTAAESLWSNLATGETFRTWVLPVHHGSPADFHKLRKQRYEALERKAREDRAKRMRTAIEEQKALAEQRAKEYRLEEGK